MNKIPKCKVYFDMTSSSQLFHVKIPMKIEQDTMFYVSTVFGKATESNLGIILHSPDLNGDQIYNCITGGNTQLTSFVLQNYTTKPLTGIVSNTDIGYIAPMYLNNNPNITLELRDITGSLIDQNKIDFLQVGIEFYKI